MKRASVNVRRKGGVTMAKVAAIAPATPTACRPIKVTNRTFGPGDYPTLSWFSNRISSGRRISNEYPYNSAPQWRN